MRQRTIRHPIGVKGIGLHTGASTEALLRPAPVNSGIIFRRVDLNPVVEIKVSANSVTNTNLCTTIGDEYTVSTIEHLMSALAGLGIDNLYIDVNSAELPIVDGSSIYYVFLIQSSGIVEQNEFKKFILIKKKIDTFDDSKGAWAKFEPYWGLRISFAIDFKHQAFENSSDTMTIDFSSTSYLKEVSRARTFGFMDDLEKLKQNKRALGANEKNSIGIDTLGNIVNNDGLRTQNEFVQHKILDAIGDLYMLGIPVIGSFKAYKSGHKLNNSLIRKLMSQSDCYQIINFASINDCPIKYSEIAN